MICDELAHTPCGHPAPCNWHSTACRTHSSKNSADGAAVPGSNTSTDRFRASQEASPVAWRNPSYMSTSAHAPKNKQNFRSQGSLGTDVPNTWRINVPTLPPRRHLPKWGGIQSIHQNKEDKDIRRTNSATKGAHGPTLARCIGMHEPVPLTPMRTRTSCQVLDRLWAIQAQTAWLEIAK
jgi:hypothetical protein